MEGVLKAVEVREVEEVSAYKRPQPFLMLFV